MNVPNAKRQEHIKGNLDQLVQATVKRIQTVDTDTVLLGPVVLDENDKPYFVLVTGTLDRPAPHIAQLCANSYPEVEALRASLLMAFIQCRPMVIHDMDDELRMAKFGEAMWPTRFTPIRIALEQERAFP